MLARQQELAKIQNQVSAGRRVLTPADDPVAASQVLDLTAAKGINKQYSDNAAAVKARLSLQETSLSAMTQLLQDVKTLTVQAGDGALSATDLRRSVRLRSRRGYISSSELRSRSSVRVPGMGTA